MGLKSFEYYRTNPVRYVDKREFVTVYVYSRGRVLWSGTAAEFEAMSWKNAKDVVIERVTDEAGLRAARAEYSLAQTRLAQEFYTDLLDEHGVTDHPKAAKCYSIAYDMGHSAGYSEVASYFDTLVDLIKD
jgi:hypothetical protein